MANPIVAIVGRPNVGKSTLFNRLTGNRTAVVEGEPNVTRDRIYGNVQWLNRTFTLIDTGGIELEEKDIIKDQTKKQAEIAIEDASVILFVVDGRTGLTSLDEEIAQILRRSQTPIIPVINKIENFKNSEEISWEFYSLGFGEPISISAEHGKNTGNLLDKTANTLPEHVDTSNDDEKLNIAIVGKPNVGKSSLVNYITGQERVIVSEIPGTTRDAIDTNVEVEDTQYNLIDTAGLRRKARVKESVEYYSNLRSIRAIERADAVLMMIDATEGITDQDKKISGYAHDHGKPIVLAINKWDLIEKDDMTMEHYRDEVYYELKFLNYAPITFISAITGKRVDEAIDLLDYVVDQSSQRVKTGILNEVIQEAIQLRQPPSKKGKSVKIFYVSQVGVKPPQMVFFVNRPDLMHFAYQRYLENVIRENFGFIGSPLKIKLRKK
jgi:GTP-binding protein